MSNELWQRTLTWPLRQRAASLTLTLLLTGIMGASASRLVSDVRQEKGFPSGDPRIRDYEHFKERFGADDQTAFVLLERSGSVLELDAIARIHSLTEGARRLPGADPARTTSLSRNILVRVEDQDTLALEPLYEPARKDSWSPSKVEARLHGHPVFANRLVSSDARLAGFLVKRHSAASSEAEKRNFARAVKDYFNSQKLPDERLWFEGIALTRFDVLDLLASDSARFLPLSLLALLCSLGLVFGRIAPVLLSASSVLISATWTLGTMALLGIPMSYISTAIPAMILVSCVGDAVYLLSQFDFAIVQGLDREAAADRAVRRVSGACLLTSVTTAAGFASLLWNDIEIIRELGLPVALGVLFAWLVTFLLIPPILTLAPQPKPREQQLHAIRALLDRLASHIHARPRLIIALAFWLAAAALASLPWIQVESRLLEDLDDDAPLMATRSFFEQRMGGACPLELLIDLPGATSDQPDQAARARARLLSLEVQSGLQDLLAELRSPDFRRLGLLYALGLPDFITDAWATLNGDPLGPRELPKSPGAIDEVLLLYEMARPDPTTDTIDFTRQTLRCALRIENLSTSRFLDLTRAVEAAARRHLPKDLRIRLSGFTLMTQAAHQRLVRGLLQNFALAFLQVILFIAIFFRSLRLALISLLPNLLPLLLVGATMSLLGIPLKLGTSLVFTIVFGIAVDDTVHFIAALSENGQGRAAIDLTLRRTGTAMILTSIVLVLGYAVLGASHFRANREFGLLVGLTLAFALLADLIVLPALLHVFGPHRAPRRSGLARSN